MAIGIARRAAERALTLDPTVADAHIVRADALRILDWDWAAAEAAYRAAIDLNPSSEAAYRKYALLLAALGRHREASMAVARARELDPLCFTVLASAAWVSYLGGDYDEAIACCREVLRSDPRAVIARRVVAASLVQLHRLDEAIGELEDADGGRASDPVARLWLAHALGCAGRAADAAGCVAEVEAGGGYLPAYHLALARTGMGEPEEAVAALHLACDQKDPALVSLAAEPRFHGLRGRPGFEALLGRLRLQGPLQLTG